jgi:RNA ligase (TIGR02306 family)
MSSLIVEVCEIKSVEHHPNADRLDIANVKGWSCIVGRDSYEAGDWCVFFPPDSVLPEWIVNEYDLEFLKKGGRVGTLKLRGYISQGLVLPTSVLKYPVSSNDLGKNMAEYLGVAKYEPPAPKASHQGKVTSRKVQNPHFTKYTDIENIQNFDTVFQEGDLVVITEKIHGSNIRFGWLPIEINWNSGNIFGILRSLFHKYILGRKYEFVYGSHNVQLQFDSDKNFYAENIYAKVLKDVKKDRLPKGYTFYGEVFGKGVQDLEYDQYGLALAIFDIKGTDGKYLDDVKMRKMSYDVMLTPVPWIHIGAFSMETLKKCTEGYSLICEDQIREGCVVRPIEETNDRRIGRKVLKSINPEYLTRKNRTEYH